MGEKNICDYSKLFIRFDIHLALFNLSCCSGDRKRFVRTEISFKGCLSEISLTTIVLIFCIVIFYSLRVNLIPLSPMCSLHFCPGTR